MVVVYRSSLVWHSFNCDLRLISISTNSGTVNNLLPITLNELFEFDVNSQKPFVFCIYPPLLSISCHILFVDKHNSDGALHIKYVGNILHDFEHQKLISVSAANAGPRIIKQSWFATKFNEIGPTAGHGGDCPILLPKSIGELSLHANIPSVSKSLNPIQQPIPPNCWHNVTVSLCSARLCTDAKWVPFD